MHSFLQIVDAKFQTTKASHCVLFVKFSRLTFNFNINQLEFCIYVNQIL